MILHLDAAPDLFGLIRLTACGTKVHADEVGPDWWDTNCPDCLASKAYKDLDRRDNIDRPPDRVFEEAERIAALVAKLGQVRRITEHPDGERESVTTHTVMLALIAYRLCPCDMDPEAVLLFALVHDLVEAYAGDMPTLRIPTEHQQAAKDAAEQAALDLIQREDSELVASLVRDYERQTSDEAQFVRVLDKCLPKITHRWNRGRVPKRRGMTREQVRERVRVQGEQLRESAPRAAVAHDFFDWLDSVFDASVWGPE